MNTDRLIMLCGVSGSGKTRYARRLEADGYVRVSPDAIAWSRYGSSLATLPFAEQKEILTGINAELLTVVETLLKEGRRVVVDSTMCKLAKRDAMRRVCRGLGVEPRLVYLQAPLEVLRRRLAARRGTGPDDQLVTDAQLLSFLSGFEAPLPTEHPLLIDNS